MRKTATVINACQKARKMKCFDGKKILFLGSNVSVIDMIRYARSNGAYTIVADWYEMDRSLAKQAADEAIPISTADVTALVDYVNKNEISGVFAGIHDLIF